MKKINRITILAILSILSFNANAGNKDRTGQSAANEILINPWAATGGLFGLNAAGIKGLEALKINPAGLSQLKGTEMGVAHTRYLAGTGMSVSNVGIAHEFKDKGALAVNFMTFGFGNIPVTTSTSPEGGIGTFKPQFFNATVGYGKSFSKSMSAGIGITFISEAISNIKASAIGFDAGIQYKAGEKDNFHLAIALRNIGTNLRFSGDGFAFNSNSPDGRIEMTTQFRSDKFQLPSQLNIGVSYDFYLKDKNKPQASEAKEGEEAKTEVLDEVAKHRITPMFSFVSNSYINDWIGVAAEYAYQEKFFARLAYRYESQILNGVETRTFHTGIAAGIGYNIPTSKKNGSRMAIDYSYKHTRIANGMHTLGLKYYMGQAED